MIINGEKYACDACVRGHRVSNCQHSERELQHINKKGRPVSQCQHCRGLRRSKSSHVKCECGEKTNKCVHTKSAGESRRSGCCCSHGGSCTCSHKKDIAPLSPLDTVPETDSLGAASSNSTRISKGHVRSRSRANTSHSTSSIRSIDDLGRYSQTHRVIKPAQTSGSYSSSSRPREHGARADLRRVQSESASISMDSMSLSATHNLPPLDLSGAAYQPYSPGTFDMFSPSELDAPIWSAGIPQTSMDSIDWNMYDGLSGGSRGLNSFLTSSTSQTGFETTPTLATSPSGHASDGDDSHPHGNEDIERTLGRANKNASTSSTGFSLGPNQTTAKYCNSPLGLGLVGEESIYDIAPTSLPGADGLSLVEEDPVFWLNQYEPQLGGGLSGTENTNPYWDLSAA